MKHKKRLREKRRSAKLVQYTEENDKPRFRSYAKKHNISLWEVVLDGDQNLLHIAAKLGNSMFVRYFLKKNVDTLHLDANGDLPLHLAISFAQRGHKHAYTDLILPLVKKDPKSLDIANAQGLTPRKLLQEYKSSIISETESSEDSIPERDEVDAGKQDREDETAWNRRLAEELAGEYNEQMGCPLYETDHGANTNPPESFDHWADRIHHEYRSKATPYITGTARDPCKRTAAATSTSRRSSKKPRASEPRKPQVSEPRRKAFEKHMSELREQTLEEQRTSRNARYKNRIAEYEGLCRCLFGESGSSQWQSSERSNSKDSKSKESDSTKHELLSDKSKLHYKDIPWPFEGHGKYKASTEVNSDKVVTFLFEGIVKGSENYEKYLKAQQRRWHPDRFLQKCGSRLSDRDKDDIISMVTKISQLLNQLSEALK